MPTRSIPYSEDCFILRASCSVTGPLPTMTVGALAWCFARSQRCPHPSKFHVLRAVTPFGSRHFVHRRHITLHALPACNASIVTAETALLSTNSLLNEPGDVFEGLHVAGRPFTWPVVPHIQHSDGEPSVGLDRRCHIGDQIRSRVIPQ